jgi:4-carboxymuconolactone decarboxylase
VIDAVRHGSDLSGAGEDEADLVAYVRQLVAVNHVDQPVYDRIVERHGERWLVELTATVGQYQYIACVLGAFEVQPGSDRERIRG